MLFKKRIELPSVPALPAAEIDWKAVDFVGTNPAEGLAQLKVLQMEGCDPQHRVLEVGCGALIAGFPTMNYLNKGNYVGLDPNKWLIEASMKSALVTKTIKEKDAKFLYNDQFDGSDFAPYDYILSHSILSHTSFDQLKLFFANAYKVLNKGGKAVVSIRLAEGNRFGSPGSKIADEQFTEWEYPGVSFFRKATVTREAEAAGFSIRFEEEMIRVITSVHKHSCHDWLVLTK
ncbi:MAG TPA: class I SAM-dependent methyltransferase [Fimbriimonadaceae bacterium]|jgi:cyclopropane fatty-acyl-phospholipid synthase-like methyltransferase